MVQKIALSASINDLLRLGRARRMSSSQKCLIQLRHFRDRFLMAAQTAQSMQNVVWFYSHVYIYSCKRTRLYAIIWRLSDDRIGCSEYPNSVSNCCKGHWRKLFSRLSAAFCSVKWQWWAYPYVEMKWKTVSNCSAVTWMEYCRFWVKPLTIN